MSSVSELRNILEQQKGKRAQLEKTLGDLVLKTKEMGRDLRRHEEARELIREAGLKTQQSLQYHISDISSLALDAVFENPYELIVEFVHKRNKSECELTLFRDDKKVKPLDAAGGGVVDVAANALRVASWSMKNPKLRNVIILDEPYKHLRGEEENRRVLTMIQEISQRLNLQIIMIGDVKVPEEIMVEAADRLFKVDIRKGISRVSTLE